MDTKKYVCKSQAWRFEDEIVDLKKRIEVLEKVVKRLQTCLHRPS